CDVPLPDDAHHARKYCSRACKYRMPSRKHRARKADNTDAVDRQLEQIRHELYECQTAYYQSQQLYETNLSERAREIRRLKHALRRSEHQVEVAANEQALRTRAVRDELAMSQSEVAKLKRNWSVRSAADDETVTKLRSDLATVTAEYNELASKYQHLTAAAKSAAEERKNLQGIVRQWDYLCKRLNVATKGRSRNESDKKILATWSQFRKRVRK